MWILVTMSKKCLNLFLRASLFIAFPQSIFGIYDQNFQIGVNYTYVTLKPHDHTTFHSSLGGMQALYEYRPLNRFYGGAKLTWRQGKPKGSTGTRSLLYFDAQERLGYTFAPENGDWALTLFSGFCFRYLGQHLTPKSGSSLRFKYNEFYVPVGMLTTYEANSWLSVGLNFMWMPQVFSSVSIVPLKGARWVTTNTLGNFYAEMPLNFAVTEDKRFLITFNPFYERWKDGPTTAKSSNGTHLGLPGNTYNFYGAELNFGYCF